MKKWILAVLVVTSITVAAKAQVITNEPNKVYTSVERTAEFPGGFKELMPFIQHNLHYTGSAKGRVILQFIVEVNGSLSSLRVVRSISEEADKEAVRVMSISPKWTPGMIGGKPVRQQYTIPINWGIN